MFDLLEKLFEVVATAVSPEKRMQDFYKTKINTKLTKVKPTGSRNYFKFWLLTNGDVVPVTNTHDTTAREASTTALDLLHVGVFIGAIFNDALSLAGSIKQKFTTKQISRLKNIYAEYGITNLIVDAKDVFDVAVKSSKELAYYLEYGKEKWESKNKDDLLEKLFEVVAAPVDQEEKVRTYWEKKNKVNVKLSKSSIFSTEREYLKFWLLTNGDTISVTNTHGDTVKGAGANHFKLMKDGAYAGAIFNGELTLSGDSKQGRFTQAQISKLKNLYIEYAVTRVVVSARGYFATDVKSSKELAYYLEYGKEKWESKNTDDLIEKLVEATASDIRRKHRSIKRLFPDFDIKTKGVEDKGGLRLVDQDAETWKFKIHSGTKSDVWYDAYLHFKNVKPTLERMVKDKRLWVADKSRVDLRKLTKKFMNEVDIQLLGTCPAFKYWGPAYILSLDKYDAKYTDKETRPPRIRNPKQYGMLCKHLDRLLKVLPFYGSTAAKWVKDFYSKDIANWEEEAKEEFGWVKKAAAALIKKREEKPEVEEPEVEEPEVEKPEVEKPVTAEMKREEARLKEEPEEEKPEEEPKKEEPEEEKPEEEPKKKRVKRARSEPKKTPQPEWKPDAGEGPEEDYF